MSSLLRLLFLIVSTSVPELLAASFGAQGPRSRLTAALLDDFGSSRQRSSDDHAVDGASERSSLAASWVRVPGASSTLPRAAQSYPVPGAGQRALDAESSVGGTEWEQVTNADSEQFVKLVRAPDTALVYLLWDVSGSTQSYWKAAFDFLPK